MSNDKIKSENYFNLGGINQKVSQQNLNNTEFLDLTNLDFQTIGSLTMRYGSTMYVGQTFPGQINSLYEFARLDGTSYVVMSFSGGIFYGATTGNSQGLSMSQAGAFGITVNAIPSAVGLWPMWLDVIHVNNTSGLGANNQFLPYQGNDQLSITPGYGVTIFPQVQSDNVLSFAVLDNYLFAADGNKFFKFNGATSSFLSPPPPVVAWTPPNVPHITATSLNGATIIGTGVTTGSWAYYISFVNDRGFEGNIWPICCVNAPTDGTVAATLGGSMIVAELALFVPPGYNIQSINEYVFFSPSGGETLSMGNTTTWNKPYTFLANIPLSSMGITTLSGPTALFNFDGMSYYIFYPGTTIGAQTCLTGNVGAFPDTNTNSYLPLGFTLFNGVSGFATNKVSGWAVTNYYPRYLEAHKNILFLAGFSATPSVVWFSDVGEPEGYPPDNNFEVRTDDGDFITAMKSYANRLWIFKNRSYHCLYGDNVLNFYLQEVSNQYGALNNHCVVNYTTEQGELMSFLDRKGIIEQNGAYQRTLSNKIQPIFDSMNYAAAVTSAIMVHDKLRNQIMCAIPVNGATLNNLTVVYDYLVGAWTKYDGFAPSAFAAIQGRNNTKNVFYGNYSGMINWFGPSFLADNGAGFSTYLKSRFHHDIGESYQKMYRRLYLDTSIPSTTFSFNINFFQDYGTSVVLNRTMNVTQFQTRMEYGISAKAIAFELSALQTSSVLKLNGYTIESRLQRKV